MRDLFSLNSVRRKTLSIRIRVFTFALAYLTISPHMGGWVAQATDFESLVVPALSKHCVKCHGGAETNGKVNLKELAETRQLVADPRLIAKLVKVIDTNDMPPEGEPALDNKLRIDLLTSLKQRLRESTSAGSRQRTPIRRLNRFQYNHAVKDLFELKLDVFELPEKLMTRQDNYLHSNSGKLPTRMPDRVAVASLVRSPKPGLSEVKPFPKDLRAAHGFDNQANQLTLSPLHLEAFLRLSVSIVDSPDFNESNVGIWSAFFREPDLDADLREEVRARLKPFLTKAFRNAVDAETLERYVGYVVSKVEGGMTFTVAMKKVASAALSSPMFLYRYQSLAEAEAEAEVEVEGEGEGANGADAAARKFDQFEFASRLSFFLWGSGPDSELLRLAEQGELNRPEVQRKALDRMLSDPKIERFLDTFPSQWMQLENVMAAAPDPQKNRFFSLDKEHPASLQMVLEPLLLFDAVFIEDRPIMDLIAPKFAYQSDFLRTWYGSELIAPPIDRDEILDENRRNNERRSRLQSTLDMARAELIAIIEPVRKRLLAKRLAAHPSGQMPVDLKPYAAWEFNGDLKETIRSLDLQEHGAIQFENGMVRLDKAYLLSKPLPIDLKAKSLEVWCKVHNLDQNGGGAMGIQGPGDFFDTIVLGERKSRHWISGSNGFARTNDFPESTPEDQADQLLHLVMVYALDGTTTMYREGKPYGKPYRKGEATFPKNQSSVIFGLRHLPPGGNKFLTVSLDRARLYDRALTPEEVASSHRDQNLIISDQELRQALTPDQTARHATLTELIKETELAIQKIPAAQDPNQLEQDSQRRFDEMMRAKLRSQTFERIAVPDARFGGVITNAAMLSMTSGPTRTHPIARGAWIIEVIFNDPPPPPPNDVPPLDEEQDADKLTIREKFAKHRENAACAACHSRLDPLGFALENFDITGRWRDAYENGRQVDPSGKLMREYEFKDIVEFKAALVAEKRRFAKAFTAHLLRFALSRELAPRDSLEIDAMVNAAEKEGYRLKALIRQVVLSEAFQAR